MTTLLKTHYDEDWQEYYLASTDLLSSKVNSDKETIMGRVKYEELENY